MSGAPGARLTQMAPFGLTRSLTLRPLDGQGVDFLGTDVAGKDWRNLGLSALRFFPIEGIDVLRPGLLEDQR